MSREEIREEMKETDGRPEVKSRIRQLQRQFARARMLADVPKADVVVMNPTHYAVALQYDPKSMRAPRVLAKGRDLVALEIRRLGAAAGVAVVEAPPLARALYASAKLGGEVPPGLYLAVAQVLSYVLQVRELVRRHGKAAASGLRAPNPVVDAALLPPVNVEDGEAP
jgi:flagellar biosynthetic protein FlhB